MNDLSAKIKLIRSQKNLSQVDFAKLLGVSRAYLADIESGRTKPSRNFLEALSSKGFSIDWLLQERQILDVIEYNKNTENPSIIFIYGFTQKDINSAEMMLKDLLVNKEVIGVDATGLNQLQFYKKILNDDSKGSTVYNLFNKLQENMLNEEIILIVKNISLSKISHAGGHIRDIFKIMDDAWCRQYRKKMPFQTPQSSLIVLDFPSFMEKNMNEFGIYSTPIFFGNAGMVFGD